MTSIRLLVVDDNEVIRRQICTLLALDSDFEIVCEATDGVEAVTKAEGFQPDVVLLDITLPQMNGFQAAPLIKKVAPKASILFVTLHDNQVFVREAFAAGALGFLAKSQIPSQLGTAIRTVHSKVKFVGKDLLPKPLEGMRPA